jgi:cysteinyl-tRNA synthetase
LSLHLHNTLTRQKEAFEPIDPDHVRMYVCGPTVYDFAHVGNARPVVVFDVLFRLLRRLYPKVTYVRNITDVDDKINAAAGEQGVAIDEITARTTEAFHQDMAALGTLEPDFQPRATQHIPQMIAMIERLIATGHAYAADGHVLFDVPSMPDYGQLSRHSRDELIAGARVDVAPYKQDPADFVLWKPSEPALPGWDSPWGRGRPGWHLECSAMSEAHLGITFDIHGGGQDLIFPHHENEIAQSVCSHGGAPFVRYWVHNGYVVAAGEKMSKSLGNFFTVRELLEEGAPGEAIRLALLGAHYRQPLDFTRDRLRESKIQLDRWYRALDACGDVEPKIPSIDEPGINRFLEALEDDLNTPQAIAELNNQVDLIFHSLELIEETKSQIDFAEFKGRLKFIGDLLGLLQILPKEWFKGPQTQLSASAVARVRATVSDKLILGEGSIRRLIEERNAARKTKNFSEADRIRDELKEQGVILEDRPDGTTDWRRA